MSPRITVEICTYQECQNQGLYAALETEVTAKSLPVVVEERSCLGGCRYLQRVDLVLPNGETTMYARTGVREGRAIFPAIGEDPVRTILEAVAKAEAKK